GITHVIRGDEHVPNTARQLAIIDLMGWPRPVFAHIPMVLSMDRRKLGKRTGSTPIREYRERGFLPEALDAYLATLSWTPSAGVDPFDLTSLAASFSLNNIAQSSPVHDEEHLLHWQKEAMKGRGGESLVKELVASEPRFAPFEDRLAPLAADVLEEAPFLHDLNEILSFLWTQQNPEYREPWMQSLGIELKGLIPWTPETVEGLLRSFMKERGLKGRDFFHPLRRLLTGRDSGAPLPLVIFTLGREECVLRLGLL
nr:glutamate--tRNA ligase [Fretibacterium sp.]